MRYLPRHPVTAVLALLALLALHPLLSAGDALAARYHVQNDGLRDQFPSEPGDWSPANCYPDFAAALAAAAPGDSILFAREDHVIAASVTVAVAFLGEQELAEDRHGARLLLGDQGGLVVTGAGAALRIQGLALVGAGEARPLAAVTVTGDQAALWLIGCAFTGFDAIGQGAAGGAALRVPAASFLTVRDCLFADNHCDGGRGGAVFLGAGVIAAFHDSVLRNNSVQGVDPRGGALMIDARQALSQAAFIGCTFADNWSGGPGGALSTLSAEVLLEDCIVTGNRSGLDNGWSEGAGLHFRRNVGDHTDATPVTVRRALVTGNRGATDLEFAGGDGGGFYTSGAADGRTITLLIEDSEFRENYNLLGAGVYVSRWSEGVVRRCRFIENTAYYQGGGVFKGGAFVENRGETLAIDTCLFLRNRGGFTEDGEPTGDFALGGAVFCRMFPRVLVRHCTFVDNHVSASFYSFGDAFAQVFEHGAWEEDMRCVLQNSVFWGSGDHRQVFSSSGGLAVFSHCAAAPDQLELGGLVPIEFVALTGSPFVSDATGQPLPGGPLVDRGLDLGFLLDLDQRRMPSGPAPDIGCFEADEVPAGAPGRLLVRSNPAVGEAELRYAASAATPARLDLHDARGRLVRSLWRGSLVPGDQTWHWDGRDQRGHTCAAGVYVARLASDDRTLATAKLVLLR
jgi:hypothetical protein